MNITFEEYEAIILSLRVAAYSCLFSLPIGIFVAYVLSRVEFYGKVVLNALVYLPLVLPPVVIGYILLVLFGSNGPIGIFLKSYFDISFAFNWTGAALACGIMGFPLMVRSIRLSIDMIDRKIELAASSLGANRLHVFILITLPLMMPGILVGITLSFARAFGEFGATITFVSNIPGLTQTLPVAIYSFLQIPGGEIMAFRMTIISVSMTSLIISELLFRKLNKKLLNK